MSTPSPLVPETVRQAIRVALGESRWASLPQKDRDLIDACAADAAAVQLLALAANGDAAVLTQIRREKAHVDAQLASLSVGGANAIAEAIWSATSRMLSRAAMAVLAA